MKNNFFDFLYLLLASYSRKTRCSKSLKVSPFHFSHFTQKYVVLVEESLLCIEDAQKKIINFHVAEIR